MVKLKVLYNTYESNPVIQISIYDEEIDGYKSAKNWLSNENILLKYEGQDIRKIFENDFFGDAEETYHRMEKIGLTFCSNDENCKLMSKYFKKYGFANTIIKFSTKKILTIEEVKNTIKKAVQEILKIDFGQDFGIKELQNSFKKFIGSDSSIKQDAHDIEKNLKNYCKSVDTEISNEEATIYEKKYQNKKHKSTYETKIQLRLAEILKEFEEESIKDITSKSIEIINIIDLVNKIETHAQKNGFKLVTKDESISLFEENISKVRKIEKKQSEEESSKIHESIAPFYKRYVTYAVKIYKDYLSKLYGKESGKIYKDYENCTGYNSKELNSLTLTSPSIEKIVCNYMPYSSFKTDGKYTGGIFKKSKELGIEKNNKKDKEIFGIYNGELYLKALEKRLLPFQNIKDVFESLNAQANNSFKSSFNYSYIQSLNDEHKGVETKKIADNNKTIKELTEKKAMLKQLKIKFDGQVEIVKNVCEQLDNIDDILGGGKNE